MAYDSLGGFVAIPALRRLANPGVVLLLLNIEGRPIQTAAPYHPINGRDRIAPLGLTGAYPCKPAQLLGLHIGGSRGNPEHPGFVEPRHPH